MSNGLVSRHARPYMLEALAESRAVALLGARQVGKSTLARDLAMDEFPARYISLDDEAAAATARGDARGFIAEIEGPTVIDEVQRAPGLLLAIKERLDLNQVQGWSRALSGLSHAPVRGAPRGRATQWTMESMTSAYARAGLSVSAPASGLVERDRLLDRGSIGTRAERPDTRMLVLSSLTSGRGGGGGVAAGTVRVLLVALMLPFLLVAVTVHARPAF